MTKPRDAWTVLPHRTLQPLGASMLTVTGDLPMPLTQLERRMTVVRLRDGHTLVHNAIALDEAQMAVLEGFGTPAWLVVPSPMHRQDAAAWKKRYPQLKVVATAQARARVEEVVPVDTSSPDFGDPAVRFVEVAGTAGTESALEVEEDGKLTLVLNDIVGNLPRHHGLVLRALGFATDRPRIPRMAKRMLVKDAAALRAQLLAWAERPLARILVAHGDPIEDAPCEVLREIAQSL